MFPVSTQSSHYDKDPVHCRCLLLSHTTVSWPCAVNLRWQGQCLPKYLHHTFLFPCLNNLYQLILTPHLGSWPLSLPGCISYDITSATSESKRTSLGKSLCVTSQEHEAVWSVSPGQADNPRDLKKSLAIEAFLVAGNTWQKPDTKPKKGKKNIYICIFFVYLFLLSPHKNNCISNARLLCHQADQL